MSGAVAAGIGRTGGTGAAGSLLQQVDRGLGAKQFEHRDTQAAPGPEVEGSDVERFRRGQVGNVDVEQQLHASGCAKRIR